MEADVILEAVNKYRDSKIGIAFSGGINSTLLALSCHKLKKKFTLYTVGLQDSEDIDWATRIAIKMNWPLKIKLISNSELTETIVPVVNILKTDNPEKMGLGCVAYAVQQFARENRSRLLLFGADSAEPYGKLADATCMSTALPFAELKPEHKTNAAIIAAELGLPEELSKRPKMPAQQGSGFDKAIERLAKQNGCKTKKEYLASLICDEIID